MMFSATAPMRSVPGGSFPGDTVLDERMMPYKTGDRIEMNAVEATERNLEW